jgi:pimeloyl-ACP methyl ester carboxylesterase
MHFADIFYRTHDDLRLYSRDYPAPRHDAPVVMCLPGLTRNSKDFAALAEHLCGQYRVICPDQRGRGRSERDPNPDNYRPDIYVADMLRLADLLQVKQFSIVGTSLGGLMAIMITMHASDRIQRIVLNDVGPEIDPKGIARIASYVGKSAPVTTWAEAAQQTATINGIAFPEYTESDWREMAHDVYVQEGERPVLDYDPMISRGVASGSATPNLWPLFNALQEKPVLALRGETSDILSEAVFAEMAQRLPHLTPVVIPNRGHAPSLKESVALKAIDTFLMRQDA